LSKIIHLNKNLDSNPSERYVYRKNLPDQLAVRSVASLLHKTTNRCSPFLSEHVFGLPLSMLVKG